MPTLVLLAGCTVPGTQQVCGNDLLGGYAIEFRQVKGDFGESGVGKRGAMGD